MREEAVEIEETVKIEEENQKDDEFEEVDFSGFVPAESQPNNKAVGEAGVLSIVNSERNGKRITIGKDVLAKLNYPKSVQVAFTDTTVAIGEQLPNNTGEVFNIRKYGAKGAIYSANLVQEMTDIFNLDFSKRVSITFHESKYGKSNGLKFAIITMS